VASLEIRNAGALNILSSPVVSDLTEVVSQLRERSDIRVLVVRGSGDRAFVGGADIIEMAGLEPSTAREFITRIGGLCEAVRQFPAPVIASVAGWCFGAGLELAAACDLRICTAAAGFGMPEVAVGIPSVVHAALLPRLIGQARASWLMLTAETIDAKTALSWGLVNEVCEVGDLDAATDRAGNRFLSLPPAAVRQQKRLLRMWEEMPIEASVEASIDEFAAAFTTGEPKTYMTRFIERTRHQ
jgi:enoyl-CoA hydratase/carnithine racemase